VHPLYPYVFLCALVAWLWRRRLLGFWGNFILAFFASPPLLALVLIIGTLRRGAPSRPAKAPPAKPVKPVAG
jgi:hypothetical protein